MPFTIAPATWSAAQKADIPDLLLRVYVDGGFTDPVRGREMFAPERLMQRGRSIVALDVATGAVIGHILLATSASPERQVAQADEAESHLLAVDPSARGQGIGDALIESLEQHALSAGYRHIVLSTQPMMLAAHRLYRQHGFVRCPARDWSGGMRRFLVYEKRDIARK
jgi:GNAT superfamily N-acetyltransferase